nr:MAG TPA: hypothetical protein [Caudoviricetes sp.]
MLGVTTQTFTIREDVGNNWHINKRNILALPQHG